MLVRNPIVVPANGYQQSTTPNKTHMAGWRAGRREISEGRDHFLANNTAESTPRHIFCRQHTRQFLCDSKRTRTLDNQHDGCAHTLSTTWITTTGLTTKLRIIVNTFSLLQQLLNSQLATSSSCARVSKKIQEISRKN